jgi:hypothetical protein
MIGTSRAIGAAGAAHLRPLPFRNREWRNRASRTGRASGGDHPTHYRAIPIEVIEPSAGPARGSPGKELS